MKKNLSVWNSLIKNKQSLENKNIINIKKISLFKMKSNLQNYLELNNKKGINKSNIKIKRPYNSINQSLDNSKNKFTNCTFFQNINDNNLSNSNYIF